MFSNFFNTDITLAQKMAHTVLIGAGVIGLFLSLGIVSGETLTYLVMTSCELMGLSPGIASGLVEHSTELVAGLSIDL